jgi:hypothetical protein
LREEHRLRMLENRVLKRIFGPKRDKVTGEWGRLHDKKLHVLYPSPNIIDVIQIKKNEMGRVCSIYGGQKRSIQGFSGET